MILIWLVLLMGNLANCSTCPATIPSNSEITIKDFYSPTANVDPKRIKLGEQSNSLYTLYALYPTSGIKMGVTKVDSSGNTIWMDVFNEDPNPKVFLLTPMNRMFILVSRSIFAEFEDYLLQMGLLSVLKASKLS